MTGSLEDNYRRVVDRMREAALRSGRDSEAVRLLGATKTVDAERIREAVGLGLTEIGENRVQEAAAKLPLLEGLEVRCHLIGHLQSNKARMAVDLFSCIQTVDSVELASRLDRLSRKTLPVLIEVKLSAEETKSGIDEERLPDLIAAIGAMPRLQLTGLMGIPPFFPDPDRTRPYFRKLSELAAGTGLPEVSMGMSHDFEVAIEEGATMVRIGSALFGARA